MFRRFTRSRRDFMKLMGSTLGCTLLAGCGNDGLNLPPTGPVGGSLPNGYVFYRIYSPTASPLPQVSGLSPVLLLVGNQVMFLGETTPGTFGLFSLTVDYSASRPRVVDGRKIFQEQERLSDGRVLDRIGSFDANAEGDVAVVLNFDVSQGPAGQGPAAVALDKGGSHELLLDYGQALPGNQGSYGGDFGDVDLQGQSLLAVGRYGGDGETAQGLFHLPFEDASQATIVLNTDQEVPGADGSLINLGLVDQADDGTFVLQVFGANPLLTSGDPAPSPKGSAILRANLHDKLASSRLLAACPSLNLTRASLTDLPSQGISLYGPRIDGVGTLTSHLTEGLDGTLTLYRGASPIARSGSASPGGTIIQSILPAVLDEMGLAYYQVLTDKGMELCLNNGLSSAVILSRGDSVEGSSPIDTLAYGFHTAQVDPVGRIVCYAQMTDGQEAILMGVPV